MPITSLRFLNLMMLDQVFSFIYSIFFQWAHISSIAPIKIGSYLKPTLFFAATMIVYLTGLYLRFSWKGFQYEKSKLLFTWECLFEMALAYGYFEIIVSYIMIWKHNEWHQLYNSFSLLKSIDNRRKQLRVSTKLVLMALTTTILIQCYTCLFHAKSLYVINQNVFHTAISVLVTTMQFFFSITKAVFILLVVLEVKTIITEAKLHIMNVNLGMAKRLFSDAQVANYVFAELFGYQLFFMLIKWKYSLLILFLTAFLAATSEYSLFHNTSLIKLGLILGNNAFQICVSLLTYWVAGSHYLWFNFVSCLFQFGPCAIAFACNSVTEETDKLLTICLEAQEKFDYHSTEYQELQSLSAYIGSNVIRFTAANFVEIKKSTLLSIVATATTYFIALVQFY